MKTALGIIAVLLIALGVWLSLRLGQTTTPPSTTTMATSTQATTTPQEPAAVPPVPLTEAYGNGIFSIHYPKGYTVDEKYVYQGFGPGNEITGVKFTIPQDVAKGTNLASDTYLSVETRVGATKCTAGQFIDLVNGAHENQVAYNGMIYSVASSTGAAAGNRYEETVYVFGTPRGCMAVRYSIHYGVFGNYPPGTVKEFDRGALLREFDAMRQSLGIVK
jgi:hypothetical protein